MTTLDTDLGPSSVPDWKLKVYGRALGGAGKRQPSEKTKKMLVEKQHNRCLYCNHKIGSGIERRGKAVQLRAQYDHFVPFAYSRRNPRDGFILACHVCNNIKGPRLFVTVQDATDFIRVERDRRGYVVFEIEEMP